MKQIIIAIAALLLTGCEGTQPIREADKGRPIEFVQEVPGKTKDDIFDATKVWVAENFHSAKAVIEDANKDVGRLIGNGRIDYPCDKGCVLSGRIINFTLRIDMKDGKFKTTFTNITLYTPPIRGSFNGFGEDTRSLTMQHEFDAAQTGFQRLSDSLRTSILAEKTKADF